MIADPKNDPAPQPADDEEADEMEQAQKDAAQERKDGGYQ